ncbi:glycosyltransferase family 4 protein [Baekduia soli]|uniref:Glycosyltransferase family 4 protein n=1 Tax=Baekduia soli TaxID=496014 RepID=A0A5B8TZS6_9ACTN|nr:glycosyltransferase family 4 protein [Baekduia soli]QEC46222.1 glycosyltransferase family 4 protein [Baekduia soli]
MPLLRRLLGEPPPTPDAARVPWELTELLREGSPPVELRRPWGEYLDVALLIAHGPDRPRGNGLPGELSEALSEHDVRVRKVTGPMAREAANADVVLAYGWPAAPAMLRLPGLRARAVLATAAPAPLAELGWTAGVPVIGPAWMGGVLPAGTDAAYTPMPVHRREDLVLVHGEEPLGLLAAAELHARRPDLAFAVSGVREALELPFPYLPVERGAEAQAHAFASATVAIAPPVRGWRPAALAMLACGQAVVAPADEASRVALGDAASLVAGPLEAADAVEELLGDLALRAERARLGFERAPGGWGATARAMVSAFLDPP